MRCELFLQILPHNMEKLCCIYSHMGLAGYIKFSLAEQSDFISYLVYIGHKGCNVTEILINS
jgi:hypothetical protein